MDEMKVTSNSWVSEGGHLSFTSAGVKGSNNPSNLNCSCLCSDVCSQQMQRTAGSLPHIVCSPWKGFPLAFWSKAWEYMHPLPKHTKSFKCLFQPDSFHDFFLFSVSRISSNTISVPRVVLYMNNLVRSQYRPLILKTGRQTFFISCTYLLQ